MNKKNIFILLPLMFGLASCNPIEKEIKKEAQQYLNATADYNVSEACQHCTEETAIGLQLIEKTLLKMVDSNYLKQNTPATITITKIQISNDSSAAVAYHKKTPIQSFNDTLQMRKRNGHWMAHVPITIPAFARQKELTFNYDSVDTRNLKAVKKKE